jgi:hypothetical protein
MIHFAQIYHHGKEVTRVKAMRPNYPIKSHQKGGVE